jgi:single-stranded-DNA-specific exonuclease
MEKIWEVKGENIDSSEVDYLCNRFKIEKTIAKLLWQRGLRKEEEVLKFFNPSLQDLHDPFMLKDMGEAVELLVNTMAKGEKIMLFGDYDVDGTTAVATMFQGIKELHQNLIYYIPDRYTEGYGLSIQGIDLAKSQNCTLIITLDCGVKAVDKIAYARNLGLNVIVCDHHEPGEELPNALILDPKRKDCNYPFKELSGCGVGFKLLQALYKKKGLPDNHLFDLLDFLAISIGADIVSVTGENRILAFHGLKKLNTNPRLFVRKIAELSSRKLPFTLTDVVFILAPRINAAGRIRSGMHAVNMMLSNDSQEINTLTEAINNDNKIRREFDEQITNEALDQIDADIEFKGKKSTIVYNPTWHKGVVGIVASRLIETHYRPTIVLTKSNNLITGSARSINHFNLYEALEACKDMLEQFGGHEHAAGLTLKEENLPEFCERFDRFVQENLSDSNMIPEQTIDMEIDLADIYCHQPTTKIPRLKKAIDAFEPFGPGNMKPVFRTQNLYTIDSRVLKEKHLKLKVRQPQSNFTFDAIGFGFSSKELEVASGLPFEMAYTLEINEFNGKTNVQLNIKDLRAMC